MTHTFSRSHVNIFLLNVECARMNFAHLSKMTREKLNLHTKCSSRHSIFRILFFILFFCSKNHSFSFYLHILFIIKLAEWNFVAKIWSSDYVASDRDAVFLTLKFTLIDFVSLAIFSAKSNHIATRNEKASQVESKIYRLSIYSISGGNRQISRICWTESKMILC